MKLNELTDEFLLYLSAVRGLSENTCIGYKNDLLQLQNFLSPEMEIHSITKENLLLCIGQLSKQNKSSASINRFIAAVRTMFLYAAKFNHLSNNPALELKTVKLEKKLPTDVVIEAIDSSDTECHISFIVKEYPLILS